MTILTSSHPPTTDRKEEWEERLFPHSSECIKSRADLRKKFNMHHPEECLEPERMEKIKKIKSLFAQAREEEKEKTNSEWHELIRREMIKFSNTPLNERKDAFEILRIINSKK